MHCHIHGLSHCGDWSRNAHSHLENEAARDFSKARELREDGREALKEGNIQEAMKDFRKAHQFERAGERAEMRAEMFEGGFDRASLLGGGSFLSAFSQMLNSEISQLAALSMI
jgi:hypothetical protein